MKLVGNLSANGTEGLFGCYTPCDRSGVTETGTVNLPQSLIAPLLANVPGGSGLPLPPGHR